MEGTAENRISLKRMCGRCRDCIAMVEDRRITLSLLCDGRGNIATSKAVMRGDHNVFS